MIELEYRQSLTEVFDIMKHSDKIIIEKIPISFIRYLKRNLDSNYVVNISYTTDIKEQCFKKYTKTMLSLIYRDYLCDEIEKEKIITKDTEYLKNREQELQNINLSMNKKTNNNTNPMALIKVEKEPFWKNILNNIKKIFNIGERL